MREDAKSEPPPLDAERQKLRAQGYTESEISEILVQRALRGGAGPNGPSSHPQGVFSNVLASTVAVTGYVSALFTSIPRDIATILDRSAGAPARGSAFSAIVVKFVVMGVLAYAGAQEWQHYIVSAPKTAASTVDLTAAQAVKAKEDAKVAAEVAAGQAAQAKKAEEDAKVAVEVARGQAAEARTKEAQAEYAEQLAKGQKAQACSARMEQITKTLPYDQMDAAIADWKDDCDPEQQQCKSDFARLLSVLADADIATAVGSATLHSYKAKCGWSEKNRSAAVAAVQKRVDAINAACLSDFADLIVTMQNPKSPIVSVNDKLTRFRNKCGWTEEQREIAVGAMRSAGLDPKPLSPQPTETATVASKTTTEPEAPASPEPSPAPIVTASVDRYDPEATASAFYGALGNGDGDLAASYIVAEKRTGNFSASSLTSYFGAMAERISVTDVHRVDDDTVSVSYNYRYNAKRCNTTATVTTTNRDGRAFISSIKAAC